jgi:tRNA/rRNA methyltransferase
VSGNHGQNPSGPGALADNEQRGPEAAAGEMGARPAVILVRPQLGVNIGTAMRAMANFGLDELLLVAPREGWPNPHADAAASKAQTRIKRLSVCDDVPAAISEFNWVCATTARQRDLATPVLTPQQMVKEAHRRLAEGQRVGILFGPERSGLTNDDIVQVDATVMIPVRPDFASLNLGQAVLLIAYEWMRQAGEDASSLGRVSTFEKPRRSGFHAQTGRPATKEELIGFFEHLESALDANGFLYPPEKRPNMVRNIRAMFSRMGITEREVKTLRGIVAALVQGKGPWRRSP